MDKEEERAPPPTPILGGRLPVIPATAGAPPSFAPRDANRALLSELRRVERKTRLRAEWTAGGSVERFFGYVPKGTRLAGRCHRANRRADAVGKKIQQFSLVVSTTFRKIA